MTTTSFEYEKRDYIRLPISIAVNYKFLSHDITGPEVEKIYHGKTRNIGTGGMLLDAALPSPDWLALLLTRRMHVGVNIVMPDADGPTKALCRVAWASALSEKGGLVLGLSFQEITQDARDLITRQIIKAQMPH